MEVRTVADVVLGAVLVGSALAKLAAPRASADGLATFGVRGAASRRAAWALLVAAEASLGVLVALGSDAAALAAAALLACFAVALALALRRGLEGAPCGCLGARSRVSRAAVTRNVLLAAALAALPLAPRVAPSAEAWLAAGLAVALAGIAGLGVAVAALAREVGDLRLRTTPGPALEIPGEGPEIGARTAFAGRLGTRPPARYRLAVFASDGCRLCRALEPAVASLARDPLVALEVFDEVRDAEAWSALDVPGSPYAVALALDGTVLAKGTFNDLGQLEGILATAERREREAVDA
ncbi:MAG: MauE/DoxX family redox-associated membrane protein [Solirubrobacteraceae bacterium]